MRRLAVSAFAALALSAAVGFVCFAVGGRMGFVHGYLVASRSASIATGLGVVYAQEASEKADRESAQSLLEAMVDAALVSEWARARVVPEPPFYAPDEYYLDLSPAVARLARYRRAHPRPPSGGPGDQMISEVVARHAPAESAR